MGPIMNWSDPNVDAPSNIGGIVKTGTGTWTLGGYNTYSGTTVVNQGGLVVNGTLAATGQPSATSLVTVGNATGNSAALSGSGVIARGMQIDATGTLSGTLAITGTVTSAGGTISPGSATTAGTLAVTGNVAMNSGSVMDLKLGSTSASDGLTVTGNLPLAGTLNLNLGELNFTGGTYTVMTGGAVSGTLACTLPSNSYLTNSGLQYSGTAVTVTFNRTPNIPFTWTGAGTDNWGDATD